MKPPPAGPEADAVDGPDAEPRIELVTADQAGRLQHARELIAEYAGSLSIDLAFQDIEHELATLPGEYAQPGGVLLLASVGGEPAGCGALRALPDADYPNACEMKRLYVRRAFRGFGLGRMLAEALLAHATQAGYSTLLLDTLDDMSAARGLYETLGFVEIPPYYFSPIAGAHYLKADLAGAATRW